MGSHGISFAYMNKWRCSLGERGSLYHGFLRVVLMAAHDIFTNKAIERLKQDDKGRNRTRKCWSDKIS